MKYIQFFFFFLLIACTAKNNQSQEIIERLKAGGDKAYKEMSDSGEFDQYLTQIENGDAFSIANAHLFKQYVDASNSLGLRFVMSRAIVNNPKAVLEVVPEHFSIDNVCDIPYIEPEQEVINNHINGAIKALEGLSNQDAEVIKCLEIYNDLKKRFVK